jgi:Phosphotransferase enzyme family
VPDPATSQAGFPRTAEEIDAAWLQEVLGTRVTGVRVQPLGAGFGQTSDSVRLSLTAAGDAPATVVAKFATQNGPRRAASVRAGLYDTEVMFYRELAGDIGTRVPSCLFSATSEDGSFALLLEDFPGHRPGDETVGCSPADAARAVSEIAALHAAYWGRADRAAVRPAALPELATLADAWDTMTSTFGDVLPAPFPALRDEYLARLPALHAWMTGPEQTVVHGDFRLDNLLFGPAEGRDSLVVVDWQAVRRSRGIHDIAYLVTHSMPTNERREHEADLLDRYGDALEGRGVRYARAQLRADYRLAMLYLFWTVLYITGINVNAHERAMRRKRALIQRACQAILDHDALVLLKTAL